MTVDYKVITPLLYATKIKASKATVITLEDDVLITGNLVVNGSSNYKPYWIAGKVNTNGFILATQGRYTYIYIYIFTSSRTSTGLYIVTPNGSTPFSDTNYIINISFQIEGANATGRIVNSSLSVSSFQIMTYVNNILADCSFHFTVLN